MHTIALLLEYDGTAYAGWQIQKNATAVQEVVEKALQKLLRHEVRVHGAGRTDAGVHAEGQVCSFQTARDLPLAAYSQGLNAFLPADIRALGAREYPAGFDAQKSARRKCYAYRIVGRPQGSALLRERAWQVFAPVDWEKVDRAAEALVGNHDFASFQLAHPSTKTTRRRIESAVRGQAGPLHTLTFVGEGFLRGQVRLMAGALLAVGRGEAPEGFIAGLLRHPGEKRARPAAPACGLSLLWVDYGEGPWLAPGGAISTRS